MQDFVGGIKPVGPNYPVRPVQPANKDREAGERRKQHPEPNVEQREDDDQQPHIDEHV